MCILPLGAELVCLPYQTGSYSKPGLGLTGLWVQWGLQCGGGQEVLNGAFGEREYVCLPGRGGAG